MAAPSVGAIAQKLWQFLNSDITLSINVNWAGVAPPIGAGTEAAALRVTVATDSTGLVSVDVPSGAAVTSLPTSFVDGTGPGYVVTNTQQFEHARNAAFVAAAAIGGEMDDTSPVAATEGNVSPVRITAQRGVHVNLRDNSGTEITTFPVTGTFWQAAQPVVGSVADDSPTPGNPVTVAGIAKSPDGTTPGGVAEDDVARVTTDLNRRLYVNPVPAWNWSYHEDSSNALTDAAVAADPGDGFAVFITDIVFSTGAATACNIFFEEGASKILGPYYLEAVAGRGLALHFVTPKRCTASTAITVTTSAAIAHGLDVTGFVAAV